ncbi:signal peptidase [Nocardioides sp. J9]|uniref:signal peptidase I n=1 Tax=Nocardioides sp. J9 TaxID=935844 RepID=UPI00119E4689|nr:signal peptidase I [Nocardioides sp. J9]TWG97262.1 signal peptidase [Nocardioides sp. J9]
MFLSARAALGWVGQVVAWLVILCVVVVLAVAVVVPRLAGATPYTVLSGSMQPTYPPGSLAVVKPVEFDSIGLGQVITFQRDSGKAAVVTHRVVGEARRFDGQRVLVTQGDANESPDERRVQPEQVRGEVWYSVPYLGHLNSALTGQQRQWAVVGVAALLIGYAAFMFAGAVRERFSRRRLTRSAPEPADAERNRLEQSAPPAEPAPDGQRRLALASGGAVLLILTLVLLRTRPTHQTGDQTT